MLTGFSSPYLSLLNFMLWGHLKDRVKQEQASYHPAVKAASRQEMEQVNFAMVDRITEHLQHLRFPPVIQRYGAHLGNLLRDGI